MKNARLFALTTAVCLAACGTGKPAASDSSPAGTPAPAAPESMVVAPAGKASVPSKAPVPSSPAAKPAVTPAAVAPAPVAAKPAAEPVAKPAAPAPAVAVAPSAPRADPSLGAPLYDANCRKCHGTLGVPVKAMKAKFPKLMPLDAAYFAKNTDAAVVAILMDGKGDDMKSFKDKLSHAEMGSVAAYIRTLPQKQ